MKKSLIAIALSLLASSAFGADILNQYPTGFRLIDGGQLNKMVNVVNGLTGNGGSGTAPSKGYFSLNTATFTGPTPATGTVVQAVGNNGAAARIEVDAFGSVPIFTTRRADGTAAAPTVVTSADEVGSFNFHGAKSATAYYGPAARLSAFATETWSGTAGGTKLTFSVTPNTTQTLTDAVTINQDSGVTALSTSASALVVGANATNPTFRINNSASTIATGVQITGAAAGSGVAIAALSSAGGENLFISAKGNGSITLQNGATGVIAAASQLVSIFGTPTIASGACGTTTNGVITSGTNQAGLITIGGAGAQLVQLVFLLLYL
jgi:hypothetical protein